MVVIKTIDQLCHSYAVKRASRIDFIRASFACADTALVAIEHRGAIPDAWDEILFVYSQMKAAAFESRVCSQTMWLDIRRQINNLPEFSLKHVFHQLDSISFYAFDRHTQQRLATFRLMMYSVFDDFAGRRYRSGWPSPEEFALIQIALHHFEGER